MQVIRGVGYIRVSTTEQAVRGLSLEAQEAEIRLFAKQRGIALDKIYVDKGITARKKLHRREAFMQMMDDVDAGLIDCIIVMRLDRWFRNVYDYHRMMNEHLLPHHVDWCAVKEDYDTTTTNGRLMINLRLAIAEQECDTDADRMRDVQANVVRQKRWPYGQAPLGYRVEEKRLVKDPTTRPHVEYFFEHLLLNGSLRGALYAVNERFGTQYEYRRAQTLSHRSIYYGEYQDIPDFCPAYITAQQHERVLELVKKNIRVRSNSENVVHLFTGLLICDDCGRRLNSQVIRRPCGTYHTYRCSHAMDNQLCPNNRSISERVVEGYLLDFLENGLRDHLVQVEVARQKAAAMPDNTPAIRARQGRVKELFINGLIGLEEYKRRVEELEKQIVAPKEEAVGPDVDRLKQLLEDGALSAYQTFSREEKRSFWRGLVRELHTNRGKITGPPIFL